MPDLRIKKQKSKTSLDIEILGLDEQIRKLAEADPAVARELRMAMESGLDALQGDVEPFIPVGATGGLKRSFGSKIEGSGAQIVGHFGSSLNNFVPVVSEFGRKTSATPNSNNLDTWVEKKLGIQGKEVRSVAYLIARSIGRKKRKGHFFLSVGKRKMTPKIVDFFEQALERIVKGLENGH